MTMSILYCLVSGSAITDLLKHRIFNLWILINGMLCVFAAILCRDASITYGFCRMFVTFLMLLPIYIIGGIGGGDIKLLSVIALFLQKEELITCIAVAFLIGALFGLIKVIYKRNMKQTVHFALPVLISVLLVTTNNLVCL